MKFTLSWLKDHLETDATLEQICERLTAIGYADTRPVEPNVLADGRARNRRVTILIDSTVPEKGTEVGLDVKPGVKAEAAAKP